MTTLNDAPPVLLSEHEEALMGYALPTPTSGAVAVYDFEKMISGVQAREKISREEAEKQLRETLVEKYLGTQSPIFCRRRVSPKTLRSLRNDRHEEANWYAGSREEEKPYGKM